MRPGGGRGTGITALFAGDSGTGKTMSAEVIAGDLGIDLYIVNLATVVDKYIGETEKNLDRIFAEAADVNGILLFDEADALFGQRSEVRDSHDRYANIEVAYLLQRMESFDGLAVLSTNLRSNIDEAFMRRLDAVVDFPMPDAAHRRVLWAVPRAAAVRGRRRPRLCAGAFELSGGNIRSIAITVGYRVAGDGRAGDDGRRDPRRRRGVPQARPPLPRSRVRPVPRAAQTVAARPGGLRATALPERPVGRALPGAGRTGTWRQPREMRRNRMPTYMSPGVYVEEVSSGSKPIEGVGTAIAAFVGMAPKGPANAADPRHELAAVRREVRRHHRRRLPRPRRVRLLPERRRHLLRRARRQRRRRRRQRRHVDGADPHRRPRGPRHRGRPGGQRHDDRGLRPAGGLAGGHGAHRRHARRRARGARGAAADRPRQRRQHAQPLAARARRARPAVASSRTCRAASPASPAASSSRSTSPRPGSAPTTTSATPPTAPASPASRRSPR